MAAEQCKHGKAAPKALVKGLPENQGGDARHKCAVCAYEAGFEAGRRYERQRQRVEGKLGGGEPGAA